MKAVVRLSATSCRSMRQMNWLQIQLLQKNATVQTKGTCQMVRSNIIGIVTRSRAYQISMTAESLKVACSPAKT